MAHYLQMAKTAWRTLMQASAELSAATWFQKASRCYVEQHQGCPWCGGSHCVFRSRRPEREQFCCSECDLFACRVHDNDSYLFTPGHTSSLSPHEVIGSTPP